MRDEVHEYLLQALIIALCCLFLIGIQFLPAHGQADGVVMIKGTPTEADPPVSEVHQANVMDNYLAGYTSDTPELDAADDMFEELCQIVQMEGGFTEPKEGLRLICDTILNRVDDSRFPNTIHDVIYQPHQFEPVSRGILYKYVPTDEVIGVCAEEMQSRTNSKVLFFRTQQYHSGTNPIAHIGHHYYSSK